MNRLDQFMRASGFDEVHVDGETVRVANEMGIATIELTLELVDRPDADLAYEQRKGIFEEMRTAYTVTSDPNGRWSQRRSSRLTLRSSEMYLTQRSSNVNGEQNSQPSSTGLKKWCEVLAFRVCTVSYEHRSWGCWGDEIPRARPLRDSADAVRTDQQHPPVTHTAPRDVRKTAKPIWVREHSGVWVRDG